MTDEDAFLRSLMRTPADDMTRLVYADWLDERGEAAKAEFLRLEADATPAKARLQELAADLDTKWLAVVGKMDVENCAAGGTLVRSWFAREEAKPTFLCPMKWEQLSLTDEVAVRFCHACQKPVHYCDTIKDGRDHVQAGHCVVVDLGVIRKANDLEPPVMVAGLPMPDFFDREEERLRLDPVSEQRERAKRGDDPG